MFLQLDNFHVNTANIAYVDKQSGHYRIHFIGDQQSPLHVADPGINRSESGYMRLQAWLASQESAKDAQPIG